LVCSPSKAFYEKISRNDLIDGIYLMLKYGKCYFDTQFNTYGYYNETTRICCSEESRGYGGDDDYDKPTTIVDTLIRYEMKKEKLWKKTKCFFKKEIMVVVHVGKLTGH